MTLTPEQRAEIVKWHAEGMSQRAIARQIGCNKSTVAAALLTASQRKAESSDAVALAFTNAADICTLDELLIHCKVDLEKFEVVSFDVNKWAVGSKVEKKDLVYTAGVPSGSVQSDGTVVTPLFQVKARLKPRVNLVSTEQFVEKLAAQITKLTSNVPFLPPVEYTGDSKHLLEVDPFDVHFGKYCWGEETVSDFDLATAARLFKYAIEDLIAKANGFGIQRVLFIVGNDALHADGPRGQTFAGTQMDIDTRFAKVFMRTHELHSWAIRRLRAIAPVDIVVVGGNHDTTAAWHLGHVLATEFRDDPNVTVNNTTRPRKYYAFGVNLLGFAHGDKGRETDLPLLMAREVPKLWAAAEHREWHIGHKHKYSEMKWRSTESYAGTIVRTLNTITAHDLWHTAEGYTDRRAMQAFIHHETTGFVGMFSANVFHDGSIPA